MLFFLTGEIQTGKTRWLQGIINELAEASVPTYGVIAPGRWVEREGGFEKLGIDNVLLPQGERVNFADPAERGWTFHASAIERVDNHLRHLRNSAQAYAEDACLADGSSRESSEPMRPGLLVVDELGWMELSNDSGLTEAMRLLDAGSVRLFPHAVVVVREALLPQAQARFEQTDWRGVRIVHPTEADRDALVETVLASCAAAH